MEPRLNFVTLAVADVERSRAFYVDGLGWHPEFHVAGEVLFIRVGAGLVLSLWDRGAFAAEVGYEPAAGRAPLTLAHNVDGPEQVEAALEDARRAGAEVSAGEAREWGGYSGYFADPDGFRWEVAHNPSDLGDEVIAEWTAWRRNRG